MKTRNYARYALLAVVGFGVSHLACAATAVVGQTTTITEFQQLKPPTIQNAFDKDLPGIATAEVSGNTAEVRMVAANVQAGEGWTYIGTTLAWDFQGITPESVYEQPVSVTVDYDYALSAQWSPNTGSGNAGVTFAGFDHGHDNAWYRFLGYGTGKTGTVSEHVHITYTQDAFGTPLTVGYFLNNPTLEFQAYAWAHSDFANANSGYARLTLNSVTITPVPVPLSSAEMAFAATMVFLLTAGTKPKS